MGNGIKALAIIGASTLILCFQNCSEFDSGYDFPQIEQVESDMANEVVLPPGLNKIVAEEITSTSVAIRWLLDENATGQVVYGETEDYGSTTTVEDSFNHSEHLQRINNLTPNTTYHYKVCLLYTSPSPRDRQKSRMPSSA